VNENTMGNSLDQLDAFSDLDLRESKNKKKALGLFAHFLNELENGVIRCAAKNDNGQWIVDERVKKGILLGFRLGELIELGDDALPFVDKSTFPVRHFLVNEGVRVVPGGSSVRRGAYVGTQVTIMPPAYINVGAYVDDKVMIDSHALVGSCAQVGKGVHLSAAAQLGGVLEPIGALPVIIEDFVFVGGNVGIFEGTIVEEKAVIGAGVILTRSSKIYDIPNERVIKASPDKPLIVPKGAVVVPGSRPASGAFAKENGLNIHTPLIIKYRDAKTAGIAQTLAKGFEI